MKCPQCQKDAPPDATFCPACGARLSVVCVQCGTANPPDHNFCKQCGQRLAAAAPPSPEAPGAAPSAPAPVAATPYASPQAYTPRHLAERILTSRNALEGERKQVTVLFCDIANSTALAERVGAEAMHGLLERFFELALAEVHRYEGTVNQFLGDGFMALFGAPLAHEDDARRAVLAALGIQQRLRERRSDGETAVGSDLTVRMGLNTGLVVVGRIGDNLRMDYTAVGDTTHLAARLQQVAEPGTILISEATRRLVQGEVRVEPLEPLQVKGKSEPVAAYRLVGLGPRRSPLEERLTRGLAELGRERELAALQDLLAQVMGGQGQVVGLVGEPGMGKSRLLYEFRQTLAGRPVTYLEGRCVSYGSSIPYLPWLDIVRDNCGIVESDNPDAIADKVAFGLREVGMAPEEWGMYLLHLLGVKEGTERLYALSPEAVKARTFETLRQMSLKGSRRRPIIFVVEDLHWIDRTSEEYLASLVESLTAARIFLMTTYRPGYRPPWMDRSYATQITLHRLDPRDSMTVVRSVLRTDALPRSVGEPILEKAEGNPFFLEELARALVEHKGPHDQAIPDTVQGVIMARIDRLSDGTKRLLQTASVLGREFSLSLLGRVLEEPGGIEPQLLELRRLEFVHERAGGEEPVYVFKHALTQDVAYESLLTARRHALHAAAGRALEGLYADRLEEVDGPLAYHYARSEVSEKAVTYLIRVAERSARVYANTEAIAHLEQALVHLGRLPDTPARDRLYLDVALRHAHSLYFLGRFQESVDLLLREEDRLERLQAASVAGPYYFWLAHMYSRLGDQERAAQSAHRAIAEASRCGDEATLGKAHGLLALEGHWSGKAIEGIEHGLRAASLLEKTGQQWWLGMTHFYVGINYLLTGRFEAALAALGQGDAVGEAIADPRLRCYAAFASAWVDVSRGDYGAAIEGCQRGLALSPDPVSRAYASMFLGFSHLEKGDLAKAMAILDPVRRDLERFRFPQWHGLSTALLAEAHRLKGEPETALALAGEGLEITRRARYWYGVGFVQRILGRIAWARGALDVAASHFEEALRTFGSIEARFEVGRTRLDLAALAHARGEPSVVAAELRAADHLFRALAVPKWVERAAELAGRLGVDLSGDRE